MTKPLIQIDDEVREMTNDEFTEYKKVLKETADKETEITRKAEAKAELLTRLGITEAEAQLLIG